MKNGERPYCCAADRVHPADSEYGPFRGGDQHQCTERFLDTLDSDARRCTEAHLGNLLLIVMLTPSNIPVIRRIALSYGLITWPSRVFRIQYSVRPWGLSGIIRRFKYHSRKPDLTLRMPRHPAKTAFSSATSGDELERESYSSGN